eukprot:jgi/Botrbrau1/7495/Bobra.0095s0031.1
MQRAKQGLKDMISYKRKKQPPNHTNKANKCAMLGATVQHNGIPWRASVKRHNTVSDSHIYCQQMQLSVPKMEANSKKTWKQSNDPSLRTANIYPQKHPWIRNIKALAISNQSYAVNAGCSIFGWVVFHSAFREARCMRT